VAELAALLEKEASAEIEAILEKAHERAAEITAEAKKEADAFLAKRLRLAKAQHEAALVRAESGAQLEASSLKLTAQHRAVEAVFEAVRAEIEMLVTDTTAYQPILKKLLREALEGFGGETSQVTAVLVNPEEEELAARAAADFGLTDKVRADTSVRGGVRLRGDRNITLENTLFERLETLHGDLAAEVSRVLFGGASKG